MSEGLDNQGPLAVVKKEASVFTPDRIRRRIKFGWRNVNNGAEIGYPLYSPFHNVYGEQEYLENPNEYLEVNPYETAGLLDFSLKRDDLQGKRVLNIGAGKSRLGAIARTRGAEFIDLDPSFRTLEEEDLKVNAVEGSAPVVAKGEELPFRQAAFDEVLISYVLEIVEDPRQILEQAMQAVKANGILRIYPVMAFKNLQEIEWPEGVSFLRRGMDDFAVIIKMNEVDSQKELTAFLFENEETVCLKPDEEMWEKRVKGYYYDKEYDLGEENWWMGDERKESELVG